MNKRIFIIALMIVAICLIGKRTRIDRLIVWQSAEEFNSKVYENCKQQIFVCTAFVEGYRENPYFCGARWTIGYGTTVYPEGAPVTRNSSAIDKDYARKCFFARLDKHVKPFIIEQVKRKLSNKEMLGVALFIYNVGGIAFKKSEFLQAINRGDDSLETAKKMTSFRRSAGRRATGLLKRHWVVAGLYLGIIDPDEVLLMEPESFYNFNVNFYYKNTEGYFWEYDFTEAVVKEFIDSNFNAVKNVCSIL